MEIVKLGDLINIQTGNMNKQDNSHNGKYNFYTRSTKILKSDYFTFEGEGVLIPGEGIFIPIYVCGKFGLHQRVYYISSKNEKLLNKYLYYWILKNINLITKGATGSTVKSLRLINFTNVKINLIPHVVQQQIIDIIEPFDLQKNYYEKMLSLLKNIHFSFDNDEFVFLNEICSIQTGRKNASFANENGKYTFFTCAKKRQFCNDYSYDGEYLIVSGNGDVGNVEYINDKFDVYQRNYIFQQKELIGNVYCSLKNNKNKFVCNSKGSVVKFLKLNDFYNIKISTNKFTNLYNHALIKLIYVYEKIVLIFDKIINNLIELYIKD